MHALDQQHVAGDRYWQAYDRWNAAIAEEFFSGRYGGRPVYLDLEDDVLARLAKSAAEDPGSPRDALVAAVRPTLFTRNPSVLFKAHLTRLDAWDLVGPPPCLAVLALLSLAAESMASDGELRESNYYGRLMQLIGLDPNDRQVRDQVARAFREQSHTLWDRLARWMSGRPAVRGLPTAQPLGRLTHVGLPISQALIRTADRAALHEFFAARGLQPSQEVSIRDMVALLGNWLPEGRASTGLRRLCGSDDGLEKVAEVACHELRSWRGSFSEAVRGRVSVQARISRHPRRRLRLSLLATTMPAEATAAAVWSGVDGVPRNRALGREAKLPLGGEVEAGVRELLVDPDELGPLLLGAIMVEAGQALASRQQRPLVVLAYDELANAYREAPRVQLTVPSLILAPAAAAGRVAAVLREAARPGFLARDADGLDGVPNGWILFEQVLLLKAPRGLPSELDQLSASGLTQLSIVGGVRLPPGRTWLASRAPELCVSSEGEFALRLTLSREDELTGGLELLGEWIADAIPVLELTDLDLPSGRYEARVTALGDDRAVHLHRFSLVTPESATPMEEWVAHDLGRPWSALAAEALAEVKRPLRGAELPPDAIAVPAMAMTDEGEWSAEPSDDAPEVACPGRGDHHFVRHYAQLMGGGSSRAWVCSECGTVRAETTAPHHRALRTLGQAPEGVEATTPEQALDLDALLEAASALGSGRHETLLGLVDRLDQIPWDGRRVIDLLSALGHIDIARDARWLRPTSWSIAPPTIVVGARGAFMAGWRSEGLVHKLGCLSHDLGGRVQATAQPMAPSRVAIEGLDSEGLELVAMEASESAGREIAVVHHPGMRLASLLPNLSELRHSLTEIEPRWTPRTEAMNPRTGRWLSRGSALSSGSFRSDTPGGRLYWHYDGHDARQLNWAMARWLGRSEGPPLASWDWTSGSLRCHVSSPLPALFERAAVLCSGFTPIVSEGFHLYAGLDEATADRLIGRLANQEAETTVGTL